MRKCLLIREIGLVNISVSNIHISYIKTQRNARVLPSFLCIRNSLWDVLNCDLKINVHYYLNKFIIFF